MPSLVAYKTNVAYTQARNCLACLHVGSVAIYLLPGSGYDSAHRLELFTPRQRFRFSPGQRVRSAKRPAPAAKTVASEETP